VGIFLPGDFMSKNEVTGDEIISRYNTKAFEDNFDRIFRRPEHEFELCKQCGEVECECEK
jgi:hypothetical protein